MAEKVKVEVRNTTPVVWLLGIAFVILKLCGVINWSWWLVTLPFWGGLALWFGALAVILGFSVVCLIGGFIYDKFISKK